MIPMLAFSPPVIAHRGAGMIAPENTLAAVKEACVQGAKWIEVDVKITYDGIPILMHDETIDRTTDGSGSVADLTWDEVKDVDAGIKCGSNFAGEKIPTLSDVMQAVVDADMNIIVEMKPCPGRARATTMVTIIEMSKIWPEKDSCPVISSFDVESLQIAAQMEPHWPRLLLMERWSDEWRETFEKVGASAISFPEADLTKERVEEFARLRIPLMAYTVNDPARAKELLAWGASAIYAGRPKEIIQQL